MNFLNVNAPSENLHEGDTVLIRQGSGSKCKIVTITGFTPKKIRVSDRSLVSKVVLVRDFTKEELNQAVHAFNWL